MNIVEAFTKFNNQCIILFSGLSGSGKRELAKFISDKFQLKLLNLNDYYNPSYDQKDNYRIVHDAKVLDWENIYHSVDWVRLSTDVTLASSSGVVVFGFGFPKSLLKFNPDFSINVKISKDNMIDKISNNPGHFLLPGPKNNKKNMNETDSELTSEEDADNNIDTDSDNKSSGSENEISKELQIGIFKKLTYGHYLKVIQDTNVDKYVNANNLDIEQMKEDVFGYLIRLISDWLTKYQQNNKTTFNTSNRSAQTYQNSYGIQNYNSQNIAAGQYRTMPYNGNPDKYQNYFPTQRPLYDFNDEGVDYSSEYLAKHGVNEYDEQHSSSHSESSYGNPTEKDKDSESSDEDAIFLGTVPPPDDCVGCSRY